MGTSNIMQAEQALALEKALPEAHQGYAWRLLYSLAENGASLTTLLLKSRKIQPTLLVVRDTRGCVFGGFASVAWCDKGESYYGDGECFVFSFVKGGPVRKWVWSGDNGYFMLSGLSQGLAMGGGGTFALFLDTELLQGSSGACATFGLEEPLASGEQFECQDLELWALEPDFGAS